MKEQIIELLSYGLQPHQVAMAVGCADGYISQIMEDPEIAAAVSGKRLARAQMAASIDKKIEEGESRAINKLVAGLDLPMKQSDILRTFAVLNAAKRHAQGAGAAEIPAGTTVVVQLPQMAQVHFKMNTQSEIIEVDGRGMQALPAKNVEKMLEMREAAKELLDTPVEIPVGSSLEEKLFDM